MCFEWFRITTVHIFSSYTSTGSVTSLFERAQNREIRKQNKERSDAEEQEENDTEEQGADDADERDREQINEEGISSDSSDWIERDSDESDSDESESDESDSDGSDSNDSSENGDWICVDDFKDKQSYIAYMKKDGDWMTRKRPIKQRYGIRTNWFCNACKIRGRQCAARFFTLHNMPREDISTYRLFRCKEITIMMI